MAVRKEPIMRMRPKIWMNPNRIWMYSNKILFRQIAPHFQSPLDYFYVIFKIVQQNVIDHFGTCTDTLYIYNL